MKQKKDIRITLRLTQEQYKSISEKADAAQMTIGAYVRAAALRHRVVIVDGLREYTRELKGVGRSLNQLAILPTRAASRRSTWTAPVPHWRRTILACVHLRAGSSADGNGDIY